MNSSAFITAKEIAEELGMSKAYAYKVGNSPLPVNVIIKEGTLGIAGGIFDGCTTLESLRIPRSIKAIYARALADCNSLSEVYCYGEEIPYTDRYAFENTNLLSTTLHVPASSLEEYKSTTPWSEFGSIVALADEETAIMDIEDGQGAMGNTAGMIYDLNGKQLALPNNGVNIIRSADGTTRKVLIK